MKNVAFQNISVNDRTLWIGIGNTGRSDDGLGWAFIEHLTREGIPGDKVCRYQLQIEDADLLRSYDQVIFVDASHEALPEGYVFHRIGPRDEVTFTTHALPPESVLALCRDVYAHKPGAWLLAIEGCIWGIGDELSPGAKKNLSAVLELVAEKVPL